MYIVRYLLLITVSLFFPKADTGLSTVAFPENYFAMKSLLKQNLTNSNSIIIITPRLHLDYLTYLLIRHPNIHTLIYTQNLQTQTIQKLALLKQVTICQNKNIFKTLIKINTHSWELDAPLDQNILKRLPKHTLKLFSGTIRVPKKCTHY